MRHSEVRNRKNGFVCLGFRGIGSRNLKRECAFCGRKIGHEKTRLVKGECIGNNGESHEVVVWKQYCGENKQTMRHSEVRNRKNDFVCLGFRGIGNRNLKRECTFHGHKIGHEKTGLAIGLKRFVQE